MNADRIARFFYSIDPRNFSRVDFVFTFSFVWLFIAVGIMFRTSSLVMALTSLIGMFLLFTVMLLCVVMEDVFEETEETTKEQNEDEKLAGMESMKEEI